MKQILAGDVVKTGHRLVAITAVGEDVLHGVDAAGNVYLLPIDAPLTIAGRAGEGLFAHFQEVCPTTRG